MLNNLKLKISSDFVGEFIGTFILVFFGCGSYAVSILFSSHSSLFHVACVWGIGVSLAIYATRHLSNAHLNPAISIAMVSSKRMSYKQLPTYILGQFWGAFFASAVLYLLFSSSIAQFEDAKEITRGAPESITTAKMFGEFYFNPVTNKGISLLNAFFAELWGTFALIFLILSLTNTSNAGRPDNPLTPLFIGLSVMVIICIIAPLTQAGLNPARDLAPRIFSYLAGWKGAAMPDRHVGFITVYVLGPIVGAIIGGIAFHYVVEPILLEKCDCKLEDLNI